MRFLNGLNITLALSVIFILTSASVYAEQQNGFFDKNVAKEMFTKRSTRQIR